ncbi:hypothetical protein [Neobacillus ginsengisoli]|uniref:Uncharacterized membrane protein (DUF441 family) n=1 Tax=Neobacillus ginsengisoli TaxID=904295 RepID=A0ABT9XS49_9BACI|nr:hypothetical protein [Neobacillus ginsengisoli]MDQ0198181.1 uncharacterized membrane protein (DUF441 family) [Neobacillus ginsengisoli]
MAVRIIFFLIGYWLAVYGGVITIAYLNLLTIGFGFKEYLEFITGRVECYLLAIGIIIITVSIYIPVTSNKP